MRSSVNGSVMGINLLFPQFIVYPEIFPEELIYSSRMGVETSGSDKQIRRSSAYSFTLVSKLSDLLALTFGCYLMLIARVSIEQQG